MEACLESIGKLDEIRSLVYPYCTAIVDFISVFVQPGTIINVKTLLLLLTLLML